MVAPAFTHRTPSGVAVYVVCESVKYPGWLIMSNGAYIDREMLDKWERIYPKESETK